VQSEGRDQGARRGTNVRGTVSARLHNLEQGLRVGQVRRTAPRVEEPIDIH